MDQSTTNDGSKDVGNVPAGGQVVAGEGSWVAGTTDQTLQLFPEIAVVKVVSRGDPEAVASTGAFGARPSTSHPSVDSNSRSFNVVRPTRFFVVKQLKGSLPSCLDLDVPGGLAGSFMQSEPSFPAQYGVGDVMLGFFSPDDQSGAPAPWASLMLVANKDGTVQFPFASRDQVNVNTWKPSALALSAPPPVPGDSSTAPPRNSVPPPPVVRDGSTLSSG